MTDKTCFVSLSRSDYTSLRPVIRAARSDPEIEISVIAGGSHLLDRFGKSIDDFDRDGITLDRIIDFLKEGDDDEADFARAFVRACAAFTDYFDELRPKSVFILGDRWEMLAVASVASLLRIPIIHHSGGDVTQGSMDNQTRYALSALSNVHLVALEEHRQRLLCLGEEDWRVITVGEPALTGVQEHARGDIRGELGLPADAAFALATYHPTSYESMDFADQVKTFVSALDLIETPILLTAPNPDPGSATTYRQLQAYAQSRKNVHLCENLGAERYYAAMANAEFMLGNSSSGIWEAPSFGLPVINLGPRQQDRLRGDNVIDVALNPSEVEQALRRLDEIRQREAVRQKKNPYVREDTLPAILNAIKLSADRNKLLSKAFVDPLPRD